MPISITCSACGKKLKAKETLAGKRVPCPSCGEKLLIPLNEEDAATYLLGDQTASEAPEPVPSRLSETRNDEPEETPLSPAPSPPKRRKQGAPALPPLKADDIPLWLRHLHWLLVLALLPLAFSLLDASEGKNDFATRLEETLDKAPPATRERIAQVFEDLQNDKGSPEDLFAALPDQKLAGALLARKSWTHWAFAAGSAVLFMAFFLLLASRQTANPLRLLAIGLFTATLGIVFLLVVQTLAEWSQGVWITGRSIVVIMFYIVKMIGFSYRAALDPEIGFFFSFLGYTLGVGLCEEVVKALPLLVHYRRGSDQSWRVAFLWGLASGAGFGIAEGVMYSAGFYNGISGPGIYAVRFISCVALHALWTGSVAITLHQKQGLIQGVDAWYEYIPRVVLIVGVPMLLHGLYDTLLKKEMSAAALGVAILSFLFLAFQISRLHGEADAEAQEKLLMEYKRRRAAMS